MTQEKIELLEAKMLNIDPQAPHILYTYFDTRILKIDSESSDSDIKKLIKLINEPEKTSIEKEQNAGIRDILHVFYNPSNFRIEYMEILELFTDNDIRLIVGAYINIILEDDEINLDKISETYSSFKPDTTEYVLSPVHEEMLAKMTTVSQGASSSSSYSGAAQSSSHEYGFIAKHLSDIDEASLALIEQLLQEDQGHKTPLERTGAYGAADPNSKGKGKKKQNMYEEEEEEGDYPMFSAFTANPSHKKASFDKQTVMREPIDAKKMLSSVDRLLFPSPVTDKGNKDAVSMSVDSNPPALPSVGSIFIDDFSVITRKQLIEDLLPYYDSEGQEDLNTMGDKALQEMHDLYFK